MESDVVTVRASTERICGFRVGDMELGAIWLPKYFARSFNVGYNEPDEGLILFLLLPRACGASVWSYFWLAQEVCNWHIVRCSCIRQWICLRSSVRLLLCFPWTTSSSSGWSLWRLSNWLTLVFVCWQQTLLCLWLLLVVDQVRWWDWIWHLGCYWRWTLWSRRWCSCFSSGGINLDCHWPCVSPSRCCGSSEGATTG